MFKREKSLNVYEENENFNVEITFIDEYHDFLLKCKVSYDLVIKQAEIIINKKPYAKCKEMHNIVLGMCGIKIERGFTKKITEILGGKNGCTHLIDIFQEVGRASVQASLKKTVEEKGLKGLKEILKESCVAY